MSDPLRAFLFVLVRDPETFFGSQDETDLLAKCKEMGFTSFWNTPQKTVQEGCEYPSTPAEGDEEWLGMAGQLDSSSQVGLIVIVTTFRDKVGDCVESPCLPRFSSLSYLFVT